MKIYLLILISCLAYVSLFAQNLVPNPSFEEYNSCPNDNAGAGLIYNTLDWFTPTCSTDYFHSCSINPLWSTPLNGFGFQVPKTGNAYAGFYPYTHNLQELNQMEYLGVALLEAMKKDSFYTVSMHVSLCNDCRYACDCLSIWFTQNKVNESCSGISHKIDGQPQLLIPDEGYITDTTEWTKLCWIYKAKGGEKFMTIGNFKNLNETNAILVNNDAILSTYYYFDDISVEKIPYHLTNINLGDNYTVCDPELQDTLSVLGQAYNHFLWNTGDTTRGLVVKEPGIYWVEAAIDGCFIRDTIIIREEPKLTLDLGDDLTRCPGETTTLSAGNSFDQYLWNTGATGANIQVDDYGSFWVTASYLCDTLTDTISILPPPVLTVTLPNDTTINLGETIELLPIISGVPAQYEWQPSAGLDCTDCPAPFAQPLSNTLYTLTIEDGYGCRTMDSISVSVEFGGRIYAPNAFSPNGDGHNDIFTVYGGPEVVEIASLKIFDRWGNMVYAAKRLPADGSRGWDGTFKGKPMMPGVFVYIAEVVFLNGESRRQSGEVTIVR